MFLDGCEQSMQFLPAGEEKDYQLILCRRYAFPDGSSRPAFDRISKLHNYYAAGSLLGAVTAAIIFRAVFSHIDQHLCPIQISCRSPCLVNADSDIAGIGLSIPTFSHSDNLN